MRKYHADTQCQLAFIPGQRKGRTSFSETDLKTTPYWRISQEYTYWDHLQIRIPDEIYSHKLDIRTDFRGDWQWGVVDVYVTTTSGVFSDRDDLIKLWKPVVPSDE